MDTAFLEDQRFAAEVRRLSSVDRQRVYATIEKLAKSAVSNRESFQRKLQPSRRIRLGDKLQSTLYVARVGPKLRLLFTLDDDPLFDRIMVTLFRLVKADDVDKAYHQVAQSLYEDFEYVIGESNGAQGKAIG